MKKHRFLIAVFGVILLITAQFSGKAQAELGAGVGAVVMMKSGLAAGTATGVVKQVEDKLSFWQRIVQFSQDMSAVTEQIAVAESTLDMIIGTESIFGKIYKTAGVFAPYVKALDAFRNMYDVTESMYNTCKGTYKYIDDAVAAGTMSLDEALILSESCAQAIRSVGNTGKFISDVLQQGNMSSFDLLRFINDFVKITKLREAALKAYRDKHVQETKENETAKEINKAERAMVYGESKDNKKSNNSFLSSSDVKQILKETKKDIEEPEEFARDKFNKNFWDELCDFLYAAYALIWLLYVAWTYIKEKGNTQNRDRWMKILMGLIYGILLIVLFRNVIVEHLILN